VGTPGEIGVEMVGLASCAGVILDGVLSGSHACFGVLLPFSNGTRPLGDLCRVWFAAC